MMGPWLAGIIPELILAGAVTVLLPLGPLLPRRHRAISTWLAGLVLLAAGIMSVPILSAVPYTVFDGTYAVDPFAGFFKLFAITTTGFVLLTTHTHFRGSVHEADVPTLLVLTCLGLVTLAASQNLALIALFLTLVTVGSYVLVGIAKDDRLGTEASLKFFLFGAVAASVMFYGMALLYGLTGTLNLAEMAVRLPAAPRAAMATGVAFVLVGYGFKVALAPFHVWAPDVYQGAPTPIAAFLSVGPKAAGLAVLLRTLAVAAPGELSNWPMWIAAAAALTMTVGNVIALRQTNIKRLLAYSSIAQVGYLLMGIAALGRDPLGIPGMLAYLAVYLMMNLAAFLMVASLGRVLGSDELSQYAGLARRLPAAAAVLAVSLIALAGIPPMGSFVGKAMLFAAAFGAGFAWLAVVAAINTAISLVYYVKVLEVAYLQPQAEIVLSSPDRATVPFGTVVAVGLATAATVLSGVFPQPLVALAMRASRLLVP